MATTHLILAFVLGFLTVYADPIPSLQNLVVGAKNPVGKCPTKDGEYPTYLADASDCSIFYECSAGEAVLKECLPGLCFDSTLNVCAFPPSASEPRKTYPVVGAKNPIGKCPNIDGETPTYLADSEDCGIFYECSAGRAILMECPSDLCFDLRLNVCTFPPKKAMDVRYGKRGDQVDFTVRGKAKSDDEPICVDRPSKPDCGDNNPCDPDDGGEDETETPCPPNNPCNPDDGDDGEGDQPCGLGGNKPCKKIDNSFDSQLRKRGYEVDLTKTFGDDVKNDFVSHGVRKVVQEDLSKKRSQEEHLTEMRGEQPENDMINTGDNNVRGSDGDTSEKKRNDSSGDKLTKRGNKDCGDPNNPCHVDGDHASDHNCPHYPIRPIGVCPKRKCDQGPCDLTKYLPDQDHEDIFYVCSNGRPIQMCCPDGLLFDPILNVCAFC